MNEEIVFRKAMPNDLKQIASIHISSFPNTFISSLGNHLICNLYFEYIKENSPFILAEKSGCVIGFCMGYYNSSHANNRFIKNNRIRLIFRMFILLICFNKLAWSRTKIHLKSLIKNEKSDTPVFSKKIADLLSICVIDDYKGQGVSQKLVSLFESELELNEVKYYTLSVLKNNKRAISFYKRIGLKVYTENESKFVMIKHL